MAKSTQNGNKPALKRITACMAALSLFALFALQGCTLLYVPVTEIRFISDAPYMRDGEMFLRVGNEIRVENNYIEVLPEMANKKGFTLRSTQPDVLTVSPTKAVRALKVGNATLIAVSEDSDDIVAECAVTVDYAIPKTAALGVVNGSTVQEAGNESYVTFGIEFPEYAGNMTTVSPDTRVDWYGHGVLTQADAGINTAFTYLPEGQGSYQIKAEIKFDQDTVLEAVETVNVYKPFEVYPFTVSDRNALIQDEGAYKTVVFEVDYEKIPGNPAPVAVWYNNDEPVEQLANPYRYPFRPDKSGIYRIRLTVNGVDVETTDGNDSVEIIAKGISAPEHIRFNFSDNYPDLTVSWDSISENPSDVRYALKIEATDGRVIISDFEVTGNSVDVKQFIGEGKIRDIFNTRFRIYVKSLGSRDGIYTAGDYAAPVLTPLVPVAAKEFLSKKYYNGYRNYYAKDIYALADIFAYTRLYRKKQKAESGGNFPTETFSAYIGYAYTDADAMIRAAFELKNGTGLFSYNYKITNGTVLEATVTYKTDGVPSLTSTGEAERQMFGSAMPHVSYRTPGDAPVPLNDIKLPIELRPKSVPVSTGEQLFVAAEEGFYPIAEKGSEAEKIYETARTALAYIIDDGMGDIEKAHAVYDYIMWRVTYDHAVTKIPGLTTEDAVKYAAYYLEGVFDPVRRFAVCDGISKAYSLMCNMLDIPCVRVAGEALVGYRKAGHAWNKVKVDGKWYIVDCTWGDKSFQLPAAMTEKNPISLFEIGTHAYFLKTDAELAATHFEDAPKNGYVPNPYPRTTTEVYNFYEKNRVETDSGPVNFFMSSKDYLGEAYRLVDYLLSIAPSAEIPESGYSYYVGKPEESNRTTTFYVSFDIRIQDDYRYLYEDVASQNHPLNKAFAAAGLRTTGSGKDYFIVSETEPTTNILYQHIFISVHLNR